MYPADLLDRYRKVRALADRPGSDAEGDTARGILARMEEAHPGLASEVAAGDAPSEIRRRAPPPPPPWSVHKVPDPPPMARGNHTGFDPRYNPYAPPTGFGVQRTDPDAWNGNPWRSRPSRVVVVTRSRWEDPAPHSPFADDGTLPPDYGAGNTHDAAYGAGNAHARRRP